MKSDITRTTFRKEKHYSGVRMQQGRVQLDADWNEQVDIQTHRNETEGTDAIGACGVPKDNPGFELIPEGNTIKITKGRLYLEGRLCENEEGVSYEQQPDFHGVPLPIERGTYLFYLDVWQRHLTAVEDADIREIALNGADTTTRTQTVWQVKFLRVPTPTREPLINFCGKVFDEWTDLTRFRNARLAARVRFDDSALRDPCVVPPRAGFRGVENQLYRVEIHTPGTTGTAKFKWARDNARVVHAIENLIDHEYFTISEPGRDESLRFAPGDWVEVIDDPHELSRGAGALVRLTNVVTGDEPNGTRLFFDRNSATEPITNGNFPPEKNPRVRRWNQKNRAELTTAGNRWIALEDGVEVKFGTDDEYQTGDYWLIPARVITGSVDWPLDGRGRPVLQQRFGIEHHFCRLGILSLDTNGNWTLDHDCRQLFSPLVEQRQLFYVSGDGQEGLAGEVLPQSFVVGVTNGQLRIKNARVRFVVNGDQDSDFTGGCLHLTRLEEPPGCEASNSPGRKVLEVATDLDGLAECFYQLDSNEDNLSQQVEAFLLDFSGEPVHLPVRFNTNVSRATRVALYDVPDCGNDIDPTIRFLLRDLFERGELLTVKDVFDILLCHLDAMELPFKHFADDPLPNQSHRFPRDSLNKIDQNVHAALNNLAERVPPGAVMSFALSEAPKGWLECNGEPISEQDFPDLYKLLQPNFTDQDGVVRVPDLRGEFVRGWDHGRGVDPYKQEAQQDFDRPLGSPQNDRIVAHTHKEEPEEGHSHSIGDESETGTDSEVQFGGQNKAFSSAGHRTDAVAVQLGHPVDESGSPIETSSETRPRNIALMYCIKY